MKAYTIEQDTWLREHQHELDYKDLTVLFNQTFDTDKTTVAIECHCRKVLKIQKQTVCTPRRFTPDIVQWLTTHRDLTFVERTKRLNDIFNTDFTVKAIQTYCSRHKLYSTIPNISYIQKGHKPWSTGLRGEDYWSHFTDRVDKLNKLLQLSDTSRKYIPGQIVTFKNDKIKNICIAPNRFQRLSTYNYIQKYGKIPEGYQLIHIDGDLNNTNPDSLELIPIKWLSVLNSVGGLTDNVELNKTKLKYCRLFTALKQSHQVKRL